MSTDFRLFLRSARRHPGFCAAIVGILSLGIAASAVVWSAVDALVLHPFALPEPERLVAVGSEMPRIEQPLEIFEALSGPELADLVARSHTLQTPLPYDLNSVRVQGPEYPLRLFAGFFWADPFVTLGVAPRLGRGLRAEEIAAATPVVVISHAVWQTQLGGDPEILGRPLTIDGVAHEIVGVMPPHTTIYDTDLWLPMNQRAELLPRVQRQFNLLARIAPGHDLAAVDADLRRVAQALETEYGAEHAEYQGLRFAALPWAEASSFSYRQEALLTLASMGFVLALVCANLANLLVARAAARQGEMAVRSALGAGRWRLLRAAGTESALFAVLGGVVGWLLANWGIELLATWLPPELLPGGRPLALDERALGVIALATLGAGLVFGTAPALALARSHTPESLVGSAGRSTHGRRMRVFQRFFVAVQVALAVVLLTGTGLLIGGLAKTLRGELGFDTNDLLYARLTLPRIEYQGAEVPGFFGRLSEEVAALPGVASASVATQVAPSTFFRGEIELEGSEPAHEGSRPRPFHTAVGDGYFETMGLRLLRGRPLDARDRLATAPVVVINELAAERFFPGRDPLGQRLRVHATSFDSGWAEVVGVVASVRNQGLAAPAEPEVFTHHHQAGERFNQLYLVARTEGEPLALLPQVRAVVKRLDPEQPIYAIGTAEQDLAAQTAPRRVAAGLLSGFSLFALMLAAVGIYGVVAHSVAERNHELALRSALGASAGRVVGSVVAETFSAVGAGLAAGLAAAWAIAKLLDGTFEALGSFEPMAAALPVLLLAAAAATASVLPARRAARRGPAAVLRGEQEGL